MHICVICGFSCGTAAALEKHAARTGHATATTTAADTKATRCPHIGQHNCGCSKFRILGLPSIKATQHDLQEAMKRLSLEWHPDRTRSATWMENHRGVTIEMATEEFKKIRAAFEELGPVMAGRHQDGPGGGGGSSKNELIDAIKSGSIDAVRDTLAAWTKADDHQLHGLDNGGMDALTWACRLGRMDMVDALIAAAAAREERETRGRGEQGGDSDLSLTRKNPL